MKIDRYPGLTPVLIVVLLKIVLLFWIVPSIFQVFPEWYHIGVFADGYADIAMNLVEGHGYRFYPNTADTLLRTPGYPLMLAALFTVFGKSLLAAQALNIIFTFLAAWLIMRITASITENTTIVVLAPLIFLFHPAVILAESRAGIGMLTALCIVLYIYVQCQAIIQQSFKTFFFAGIVLGIASLVRSTPILFPLFLLVYLLLTRPENFRVPAIFAKMGVMVCGLAIVLAPWTIRNHVLVGKFVPTMSVLGVTAYQGKFICKNIDSGKGFHDLGSEAARKRNELAEDRGYDFSTHGYYQFFFNAIDEVEFSDYLKARVIQDYIAEPGLFVKCSLLNTLHFWFTGKTWKTTMLNAILQIPFLALFILGIYLVIGQGKFKLVAPMLLFILYFYAAHIPVLAVARYSVPLIPLMSIFVAFAVYHASRKISTAEQGPRERAEMEASGERLN